MMKKLLIKNLYQSVKIKNNLKINLFKFLFTFIYIINFYYFLESFDHINNLIINVRRRLDIIEANIRTSSVRRNSHVESNYIKLKLLNYKL